MRELGRRERYGLVAGAVVLLVVIGVVAFLLLRRPPAPAPRLRLDAPAIRPESATVSDRYAAWSDRGAEGKTGIILYDPSSASTMAVTEPRTECSQPAIAGGSVVYVDNRTPEGDLYRYDVASRATRPFVVAPGTQGAPSADGDWVVWEDDRTSYGPRVRAKRLSGGAEVLVPTAKPGDVQRRPRVAGGLVVWEEYESAALGGSNAAIIGYDLAAARLETISPAGGVQLLPATDGRYVVWSKQREGVLDVAVWDRRSRTTTEPGPPAERATPAVGDGIVYWVERDGRGRLTIRTWAPGRSVPAPLTPPASVDQAGIAAESGSRMWFEQQAAGWRVRARLAGGGSTSAEAPVPPATATPLPAVVGGMPGVGRLLLVQDVIRPSPPVSPVASTLGTSGVQVEWLPATDDVGIVGYDVYRSASPITLTGLADATRVATVTGRRAQFPAAPNEAAVHFTLYYAVLARDAAGNVSLSANTVPNPHGTSVAGTSIETCERCHQRPGTAVPDPARRQACYRCHGDTPNTTAYGARAPEDVQAQFMDDPSTSLPPGGSRHRNAFMTDTSRECDGCHTPHRRPYDPDPAASFSLLLRTRLATTPAGQNGYRYNTDASPVGDRFCLDCHGTNVTPISLVGGSTAYLSSGGDHETGWASSAHGSKVAPPAGDPGIGCLACHDAHASRVPRLLGLYDQPTQTNRIAGVALSANDSTVCLACHDSASAGYPVYSRDASGFPIAGAWPGAAVWDTPFDGATRTGSMHATRTAVWPGSSFAGGDCKNCHRMHGPSNRYAILRDTDDAGSPGAEPYLSTDFRFCFNCHDGTPGSDVRRFYPPASGGTSGGDRAGHRTSTEGTLAAGSALPCYDCHDPHGSGSAFGLKVVTQTTATDTVVVGDASGELTMGPAASAVDVRHFCLSCHTSADTAAGWDGSAMTTVSPGARFEGIDRVSIASLLRLPGGAPHAEADTRSCYDCHGDDYSGTGGNVHEPAAGAAASSLGTPTPELPATIPPPPSSPPTETTPAPVPTSTP